MQCNAKNLSDGFICWIYTKLINSLHNNLWSKHNLCWRIGSFFILEWHTKNRANAEKKTERKKEESASLTGQLSKYWSCLFDVYNNMLLTQLTFSSTELKSGIRIENIQTGKQISLFSIDLQRILYIWANCTSIEIDGKKMLYIVKSNRMKWQWNSIDSNRIEDDCVLNIRRWIQSYGKILANYFFLLIRHDELLSFSMTLLLQ